MIKRVLYITNCEVPYRIEFFNKLSQKINLTVIYENAKNDQRDENWSESIKNNKSYNIIYLSKKAKKRRFSIKALKYIFDKYDEIIFGCINNPIQISLILIMKILHKEYSVNLDGEVVFNNKNKLKKFILNKAKKYYVAGEKSANNLKKYLNTNNIYPYYFSSLTEKELELNEKEAYNRKTNDDVLVVGRNKPYKGLDIALEVAKINKNINFRFVGMGKIGAEELVKKIKEKNLKNVEIIPFLNKEELNKQYNNCKCMLLPSKKECWGLVINEAASFGTPIVSTLGSGAAVEFLEDEYNQFLAKPNDPKDLSDKLKNLLNYNDIEGYRRFLLEKSHKYSVEKSVECYLNIISK